MNIIENINERLDFDREEVCAGGEQELKQMLNRSPIQLPEDYIQFLKDVSGAESNGVAFQVKDEEASIWIWDAATALQQYKEYKELSHPLYEQIINRIWLIGNNLGDLVYFYGDGKDGFGLYKADGGSLGFKEEKIADTLTDFLVNGVGIDIAITL